MSEAVAVRERPIIFSGEMVRAILDGRKTMTRRVIRKPERLEGLMLSGEEQEWCPYGRTGDRLWVREAWGIGGARFVDPCLNYREDVECCAQRPIHRVGPDRWRVWQGDEVGSDELLAIRDGWRSPIFMPRWASRLTLEITEVRVQLISQISREDRIAEGVASGSAVEFQQLWDSINESRGYGWDQNPYVWAISFRRSDVAAPR